MSDAAPPDPASPEKPREPELHGLDPGELLAHGLQIVKPSVKAGPWEPPTPEELGRLLPQYRIESLLGRGGMGAVYKGTQPELERPVAIKLLPAEVAADGQFVTRFKREARTLAKLQHSRIITIHDFGQTSAGHLYFVMEYIDGTNLRDILRGPGLTAEQALLAVSQICDALQAAHKQGVIHRDIKPENVLITRDGYVKLADFGLARPRDEDDAEVLTGTHVVMGTPAYMSPEQRAGHSDHRSDIYALGVMLYEMLTGKRPQGAFDPPSFKVQVDVRLDQVVLRALQEQPERRYQEVGDFKKDLDTIRATPPEVQKNEPPGDHERTRPIRPLHRRKVLLVIAAALLAAIAALVYFAPWKKGDVASGTTHVAVGPVSPPAVAGEATPALRDTRSTPAATPASDRMLAVAITPPPAATPVPTTPAASTPQPSTPTTPSQSATIDANHLAPGDLDTSFGNGGKVITVLGTEDSWASSVAVQDDGKILVSAFAFDGTAWNLRLVRYNADGTLDGGFVSDGKGNRSVSKTAGSIRTSMAIQRDRKIVVSGASSLSRYNTDGTLDSSFNSTGIVTRFGHTTQDITIQVNGKIVVAGWTSVMGRNVFAVTRCNANGSLDTTFNHTGTVTTSFGSGADLCQCVASQADGKIVAAGYTTLSTPTPADRAFALARYNTDGSLDTSFNGSGKVTTDITSGDDEAHAVTIQSDGKILAVGFSTGPTRDLTVLRYNSDGSLDTSFNTTGKVTTSVGSIATGYGVAVQSDGRIVVGGTTNDGKTNILLVRYTSNGLLDTTLKGTGTVTTSISVKSDFGSCLALQKDGKMLVAGLAHNGRNYDCVIVRYIGGPATDVEKWFAQVDGPQQEAFQTQVLKPYEAGVAGLRIRYLASLDAAIAKASAAGQLAEALAWRTGRQAFEKAEKVVPDEADTPVGVETLRAAFRQQLAKLDEDRTAKARALLAPYDAILAKNQSLLTQHQRFDDALLLKTKRDEIALAWVGSSQPTTVDAAAHPVSAKSDPTLLASKELSSVNSLGMKFVPVPITEGATNGKRVLFSVWDTRVQDYEVFVKETKREWWKPEFEQGPTHPVVRVSWDDAQAFCAWLTDKERVSGTIGAQDKYRLPSDHEWSCAVGIGHLEKAEASPESKSGKIQIYPWGTQWPPPKGAGNYAGEELRPALAAGKYSYIFSLIAGYRDDFVETAPVGSFSANRFGLFDMGGNVWQWCEEWADPSSTNRVLRGASWAYGDRYRLLSSTRKGGRPGSRYEYNGFRCVLAISGGNDPKLAQAPSVPQATPNNKDALTKQMASATKYSPFVNSLEMKFAPVPITGGPTDGQRVLFSVWKTRVQDYEVFATETKQEWTKPEFLQGTTHPAVKVSWEDAQLFCQWLTGREQGAGRLPAGLSYRLPSDHEWSCAVGIGAREHAAMQPAEKNGKIIDVFPWGSYWPPRKGAGNYASSLKVDEFLNTSPVGSFSENRLGLRDLGGNAWEWCEDLFDKDLNQNERVLRGASWSNYDRISLLSSYRYHVVPGGRLDNCGFRCVVGVSAR